MPMVVQGRFMLKYVAVLILSIVLGSVVTDSQVRKDGVPQTQPVAVVTTDSISSEAQKEQLKRLFLERQAQLRADTAKLVTLTAELKQQVDKTDINVLSIAVIKKAQEIQKLAKSVQDKMRDGY
jgi:nicotinic acid phosphoribosyltransferase